MRWQLTCAANTSGQTTAHQGYCWTTSRFRLLARWCGAGGAVIVGINPTRDQTDMAADIRRRLPVDRHRRRAAGPRARPSTTDWTPQPSLCIDDPAYAAARSAREQPASGSRGRARAVVAAVHLGHHGDLQSSPVHQGRLARIAHTAAGVQPRPRRRRILLYATVSRQRDRMALWAPPCR